MEGRARRAEVAAPRGHRPAIRGGCGGRAPGEVNSVQPAAVPGMAQTEVKTEHPLSWDRLSMTVASMVAWNMQVDVADDVISEPVDSFKEVSLPMVEGPLQGSGEFEDELYGLVPSTDQAVAGHSWSGRGGWTRRWARRPNGSRR